MGELRGLRDLTSDLQGPGLALAVDVDRDTASRMGVTAQAIDDTLYDALGQRQASIIFTQLNQYRVILELGAFAALLLTGTEFSVTALIGVVLLIGIVKKNAMMMIDFALDAERDEGLSPRGAIPRACLLRFRPIMMTTLAALFAPCGARASRSYRGGDPFPAAAERATGSGLPGTARPRRRSARRSARSGAGLPAG